LSVIAVILCATGSVQAGDWAAPRSAEATIVSEQYKRTEMHVRFEAPEPAPTNCTPYKHAMWIDGHPVVRDRVACRWPDGTLRNGLRSY